ncbi:MAG: hypothetical protein ACJ75B_12120 [Flavisolibacter sp.]|jgi:hypothetical protein
MATNPQFKDGIATVEKKLSNVNPEHKEGKVARTIEEQTSKLPSDVFLWTAIGAIAVSLTLQITGGKHRSLFFGQWVAPFLLLGIYNKLVKLEGHD